MNCQIKNYSLLFGCGAFGWYETLVAGGLLPRFFVWWVELPMSLVALAGGIWVFGWVELEIDKLALVMCRRNAVGVSKIVIEERRKYWQKRFSVMVLLWLAPVIFGLVGSASGRFGSD